MVAVAPPGPAAPSWSRPTAALHPSGGRTCTASPGSATPATTWPTRRTPTSTRTAAAVTPRRTHRSCAAQAHRPGTSPSRCRPASASPLPRPRSVPREVDLVTLRPPFRRATALAAGAAAAGALTAALVAPPARRAPPRRPARPPAPPSLVVRRRRAPLPFGRPAPRHAHRRDLLAAAGGRHLVRPGPLHDHPGRHRRRRDRRRHRLRGCALRSAAARGPPGPRSPPGSRRRPRPGSVVRGTYTATRTERVDLRTKLSWRWTDASLTACGTKGLVDDD